MHYALPALDRLPTVRGLIERRACFDLHAPRQVGKTTALLTLAQELTAAGTHTAVLVSVEEGAPFTDIGAAELAILQSWRRSAAWQLRATNLEPPPWPVSAPGARVGDALAAWARASPRPLVVFIDEIDALRGDVLISVLRQVRAGYAGRPHDFPASLALIGLRDVRDYKVAAGGSERLGTASPFNIKVESLTLRNFTRDEVDALYHQHEVATGQRFLPEAVDRAFYWTQGQPWLVNALARQLIEVVVPTDATGARAITAADVDLAKEILIERQDTHLDSLAERLREPRIRQIIEPMLAGGTLGDIPDNDRRFIVDLGLVRRDPAGGFEIANPIYREVIPRSLAGGTRDSLPHIAPAWLTADGRLDAARLLDAFLAFWRQHGEPLLATAPYHEIAPHLVLMAFLHRVANGGGTLDREYAIGRGRMDLLLRRGPDALAVELKVWRDGQPDPATDGLAQLDRYLDGLGLPTGWLVVFDRRSAQPPIAVRTSAAVAMTPAGRSVTLVRA